MSNKKSIIMYFSRADENYAVGYIKKGCTQIIAEYIQNITNADMFRVERKTPYAKDYKTCTNEAKIEKQNDERPELSNTLESIDKYETVYIGAPVYWGTMPQPMFTQLEKLNWNGKTVRVFTTHEGSGLANIPKDVKKICIGANVLDNSLAIFGHEASHSKTKGKVEEWVHSV